MALACVELSTGDVEVFEIEPETLSAHLSALRPSESLVAERILQDETVYGLLKVCGGVIQPQAPSLSDPAAGEARLLKLYGVQTLDGFGQFSPAEVSAMGMLAAYIDLTQAGKRPMLKPPARVISHNYLSIDAATRASLEIDRTQQGKREGSLIACLDETVTSGGGRLLLARLSRPLFDPDAINARLDTVAWLLPRRDLRESLRGLMRALSDQARALSRLSLNRGGPRDLNIILQASVIADLLGDSLRNAIAENAIDPATPADIDSILMALKASPDLEALKERLAVALVDEPPPGLGMAALSATVSTTASTRCGPCATTAARSSLISKRAWPMRPASPSASSSTMFWAISSSCRRNWPTSWSRRTAKSISSIARAWPTRFVSSPPNWSTSMPASSAPPRKP